MVFPHWRNRIPMPIKHPAVPIPDITYIVSAFNRPWMLPVCLWSIKGQSHTRFECMVTDNATDRGVARQHRAAVAALADPRFRYLPTAGRIAVSDCYWAAEYAIDHHARGHWLCFPCDDTYYVPQFGQRMLAAAYANGWDFAIAGQAVVGPEASGNSGYRVWEMSPGKSIKTSFMVRRDTWERVGRFAAKPNVSAAMAADYAFSAQVQAAGVRWGKVDEVLLVHN